MTAATLPPHASHRVFGEPQLRTDGELLGLAFGPDGTLWSIEDPGVVRRWNPSSGHQLEWHSLSDLETLWAFSPDGRLLASASDDLTLWDPSAGMVLTAVPQPSWVTAIAFSSDPVFLATGHDDGIVRYWDASGHKLIHELQGSKRPISALAFSPDRTLLAAASEDKTILLWDLELGKVMGQLKGHTDRIPALAWHAGNKYLVSAGWDTTARVWDVHTLEPVILLNSHSGQVTALAFSKDGQLLACADEALTVHVWDFPNKKTLHVLKGPQSEIRSLAFSHDGQRLAANGLDLIHLWDARTGQAIASSGPRQVTRTSIAVSKDGTHLAGNTGGAGGRVWISNGRVEVRILEEDQPLHALAYDSRGALLGGAADRHLRLWDAVNGKVLLDCEGPEEPFTCLAFSPTLPLVAGASNQGLSVWIYRTQDGEPVLLIPDALDGCTIETLAFHPTRPLLAVGGIDWLATGGSTGAICLWDIDNRHEIATFSVGTTSLAIHPTGDRLVSSSVEQTLCVWDLNRQELLAEFAGHDGAILCVAYHPDGKSFVSGGEDRTVRFWNEEGDELGFLELDSQVNSLAFSPDGQFLYTGNANTTCYQLKVADILGRK